MNTEDSEFERIEREALRRAAFQRKVDNVMRIAFEAAWEDDDTQSYTSEAYRCGFEAGAVAEQELPPEWPLIKNILAEYGLDAISFVAEWKAAQRPWVGLTEEDWGWVADRKGTSLDSFDQGAAWAQARLKERNT